MLFRKSRKPKKFNYEPRYYDPSADQRRNDRIRFRSSLKSRKRPPLLVFLIAFILLVIVYMALGSGGG